MQQQQQQQQQLLLLTLLLLLLPVEMKASIERALSNVTHHGNTDKCLEVSGDSQWTVSVNEFRRKRFVLFPTAGVDRPYHLHPVCIGGFRATYLGRQVVSRRAESVNGVSSGSGGALQAPIAGSGAELQPKSNLMHFP